MLVDDWIPDLKRYCKDVIDRKIHKDNFVALSAASKTTSVFFDEIVMDKYPTQLYMKNYVETGLSILTERILDLRKDRRKTGFEEVSRDFLKKYKSFLSDPYVKKFMKLCKDSKYEEFLYFEHEHLDAETPLKLAFKYLTEEDEKKKKEYYDKFVDKMDARSTNIYKILIDNFTFKTSAPRIVYRGIGIESEKKYWKFTTPFFYVTLNPDVAKTYSRPDDDKLISIFMTIHLPANTTICPLVLCSKYAWLDEMVIMNSGKCLPKTPLSNLSADDINYIEFDFIPDEEDRFGNKLIVIGVK